MAAASAARACTSSGRSAAWWSSGLREPAAVVVVAAQPPVEPQLPCHPGRGLDVTGRQRALGGRGEVGVLEVDAVERRDLAAVAVARVVGLGDGEVVAAWARRPRPTRPPRAAGRGRTGRPAPASAAGPSPRRGPGSARPAPRGWSTTSSSAIPTRAPIASRSTRVVPPAKTPMSRSSRRAGASSSPWLQSRVARIVRWRGGRSRGPACSAVSSRCSSDPGRATAPGRQRVEREGQPGEALAGGADGRGVGRVGAPAGVDPLRTVEQQPRRGGGSSRPGGRAPRAAPRRTPSRRARAAAPGWSPGRTGRARPPRSRRRPTRRRGGAPRCPARGAGAGHAAGRRCRR